MMSRLVLFSLLGFTALFSELHAKQSQDLTIRLSPKICLEPYQALPEGEIPGPKAVAKDAYCAALLMRTHASKGAITIFGSARTRETAESYQQTRQFALLWSQKHGAIYPVLTGGGLGIMEAGNRGAFEAKAKSLAIATHFKSGIEKPNAYTTASYMAQSFAQRESDLVDYAAAVVVAPGGFGTEWEIFETLSKIQTEKKKAVPVILLGSATSWESFVKRVEQLKALGTISPEDDRLFLRIDTPELAVSKLEELLQVSPTQLKK